MADFRCRLPRALASARVAAVAVILFAGFAFGARAASVPNPTVSGPIASPDIPGAPTHNYPFSPRTMICPPTALSSRSFTFRVWPTATIPLL